MAKEEDKGVALAEIYPDILQAEEDYSSMRNLLYILFRHKKTILLFFIATLVSTAILTFLSPSIYESTSQVLIKVGRESVSMDPSVVGPTMSISQNRESEVNSEVPTIKSQILAERVVDKIGSEIILGEKKPRSLFSRGPEVDPRIIAINKVMDGLIVEVEKKTSIINLTYQAESRSLAQAVLDTLVTFYLDRHIEIHKAQASPAFFQERLDDFLAHLRQKEEELMNFKLEHSIASIEEQREQLLERSNRVQMEIDELGSQISASQARILSLENALKGRSGTIEINRVTGRTNYAADAIKERLVSLRLKEADLSARYPDNDRALVDVREQIQFAERELAKEVATHTEVTTGLDRNYQATQLALESERAQLQAQIARKETLLEKLKNRQADLQKMTSLETTLSGLQRELEMANKEYREYRDNHQRSWISAELDMDKVSNISIVQPATLPLDPVKPKKILNLILGALLGVFGGIGLALFLEYLDGSLKTPDEVNKRLGLPVLASVSREEFESCT